MVSSAIDVVIARSDCDEAIQKLFAEGKAGLLRFARNDEKIIDSHSGVVDYHRG
jgi:hypothetical protein